MISKTGPWWYPKRNFEQQLFALSAAARGACNYKFIEQWTLFCFSPPILEILKPLYKL